MTLILQIAAGVVLGGVILAFLRVSAVQLRLVQGAIVAFGFVIVIAGLTVLIWVFHTPTVLIIGSAIVIFLVTGLVLLFAAGTIAKKWPHFMRFVVRELFKPDAKLTSSSLVVKAAASVCIAALIVGSLIIAVEFVAHVVPSLFDNR